MLTRSHLAFCLSAAILALCVSAAPSFAVPLTAGTGPGGFDLTNGSTTLEVWLDADDDNTRFTDAGVTPANNGDPVFRWSDKSGNGNHADATSATTRRPAYNATAVSGNSAIRFDPTDPGVGAGFDADAMDITGLNLNATPYTVFILDQYYGATQGRTLQAGSPNNWLIGKWGGATGFHVNGSWVSGPNPGAGTNPHIGVGTVTGVAGGASYFINAANATINSAPTGAPGTLHLGNAGTHGDEVSHADVSEIIVYQRALSTPERRIVENYLSAKYNVGATPVGSNNTLGANDLYEGDLSTNGEYDLEVIGVGEENSASVLSAGAAGFGIEITGGLSAGEYVLAGHNVETNSIVSNGDGIRMDRVWYVDATPASGVDVEFTFDFSDAGLAVPVLPALHDFALLYSATDPFSFGTLVRSYTQNGDTFTFVVPSNLLLDGYFTIGSAAVPEPSTWLMLGLGSLGLVWRARRVRRGRNGNQQSEN